MESGSQAEAAMRAGRAPMLVPPPRQMPQAASPEGNDGFQYSGSDERRAPKFLAPSLILTSAAVFACVGGLHSSLQPETQAMTPQAIEHVVQPPAAQASEHVLKAKSCSDLVSLDRKIASTPGLGESLKNDRNLVRIACLEESPEANHPHLSTGAKVALGVAGALVVSKVTSKMLGF
jgi:hypothetical protein